MVSNIKYRSFKQWKLRERKPFNFLLLIALLLLVILAQPQIMVFILICGYVLSGIGEKLFIRKPKPFAAHKNYRPGFPFHKRRKE